MPNSDNGRLLACDFVCASVPLGVESLELSDGTCHEGVVLGLTWRSILGFGAAFRPAYAAGGFAKVASFLAVGTSVNMLQRKVKAVLSFGKPAKISPGRPRFACSHDCKTARAFISRFIGL